MMFLASIFALWGFSVYKISTTFVIETDILALLPGDKNSELVQYAEKQVTQNLQRNLVILVGQADPQKAVSAANRMREKLLNTDLFSTVETRINIEEIQTILTLYNKHSATFLTEHDRLMIENDDLPAIRKSMIAKIYGGISDFSGNAVTNDPFMLSGSVIAAIISKNANDYVLINDVPTVSDGAMHYALLRIQLNKNMFTPSYQTKVSNALDAAQAGFPDASFLRSGLIFHAIRGVNQAKTEISVMGTLSLIGVFLLLTLTFKSTRPFVFSAITIAGGGLSGFAACLLFFDKVHLLTLVFGTSLVGISIDYALHFFAHRYHSDKWNAHGALKQIFSGISLGLITSIIGFLGLCLTPFASLQQMAIFSIVGLAFVYGAVVFAYPVLFKMLPQTPNPLLYDFSAAVLKWWQRHPHPYTPRIILALVVVMLGVFPFLMGRDDVRAMQALSPQLVENDTDVAELLGSPMATQFFVVSGEDDDDLLVNMSDFVSRLEASGAVERQHSLTNYIAPEEMQMNNVTLLLDFVTRNEGDLRTLFKDLSISDRAYDDYASYLREQKPLLLSVFLENIGNNPLRTLDGGNFKEKRIGFVTLNGIQNPDELATLAQNFPDVIFVDKVASITKTFDHHRILAVRLIVAAYILVFIFLCFRYSIRQSALIISPSVLASLTAVIVLAFLGGHYSLFHILALFLVMGIGVDYGLFLVESQRKKGIGRVAMTAITLSAITTILSFGLLATSATTALHDFGMIIVIGITLTFGLSPIVLFKCKRRIQNEK